MASFSIAWLAIVALVTLTDTANQSSQDFNLLRSVGKFPSVEASVMLNCRHLANYTIELRENIPCFGLFQWFSNFYRKSWLNSKLILQSTRYLWDYKNIKSRGSTINFPTGVLIPLTKGLKCC